MSPQLPASDPLAQLADIHLPTPVASFPWAPGWWILLAAAATALIALVWLWRRHRRRTAWQRQALLELSALSRLEVDGDLAVALNQLLRRVAIHRHGNHIAGLSGQTWLRFLDDNGGERFDGSQFDCLLRCSYTRHGRLDNREQLLQQARIWIANQHRSPPKREDQEDG